MHNETAFSRRNRISTRYRSSLDFKSAARHMESIHSWQDPPTVGLLYSDWQSSLAQLCDLPYGAAVSTKRERAQWANHYPLLFGKGPIVPVPEKRAHRPSDPEQPSEHQIQCAVMSWWALNHRHYGLPIFALYANPAGGAREAITGARLKAEGVRRGVPDLTLAAMRNSFGGLYLELKRHRGVATTEQKEYISYLNAAGYVATVAYSSDEARDRIHAYLRGII